MGLLLTVNRLSVAQSATQIEHLNGGDLLGINIKSYWNLLVEAGAAPVRGREMYSQLRVPAVKKNLRTILERYGVIALDHLEHVSDGKSILFNELISVLSPNVKWLAIGVHAGKKVGMDLAAHLSHSHALDDCLVLAPVASIQLDPVKHNYSNDGNFSAAFESWLESVKKVSRHPYKWLGVVEIDIRSVGPQLLQVIVARIENLLSSLQIPHFNSFIDKRGLPTVTQVILICSTGETIGVERLSTFQLRRDATDHVLEFSKNSSEKGVEQTSEIVTEKLFLNNSRSALSDMTFYFEGEQVTYANHYEDDGGYLWIEITSRGGLRRTRPSNLRLKSTAQ